MMVTKFMKVTAEKMLAKVIPFEMIVGSDYIMFATFLQI